VACVGAYVGACVGACVSSEKCDSWQTDSSDCIMAVRLSGAVGAPVVEGGGRKEAGGGEVASEEGSQVQVRRMQGDNAVIM
jgi:hypothetical protein